MPRPVDPAREEARARGDKRYFSALACPRGHSERFVINTACCICANIRRAERSGRPYIPASPKLSPKAALAVVEAGTAPKPNPVASLSAAVAAYHNSPEARARSRHLDRLVRGVTASAIQKAPHAQE